MALARCHLVVQDENGNKVDGASIRVTIEPAGTVNAVIYSDRDGSVPLGNPFVAADGADAGFYAEAGAFKVVATKSGFSRTWRDVNVLAASEGTNGYAFIGNGPGVPSTYQGVIQDGAGAITRTWQSKARDILHASDFGVVGDSVTDNLAAFALIAALGSNKTIILPPGNIIVSAAVTPAAAQTWVGQGINSTTIYTTSATANVFNLSNASVTLRDFSILPTVTRSAGWAIDVSGPGATLANLNMFGHQNGIRLQDTANNFNIDHVTVSTKGGGESIRIGSGTLFPGPIGAFLTNIRIGNSEATVATAGLSMVNVGDLTMNNVHSIGATYPIRMIPGASQGVYNVKATMVWADSAAAGGYGIYGVTSGTGQIGNVVFVNSWSSSLPSAGNIFLNGAGGDIDGIEFNNCTANSSAGDGVKTQNAVENLIWIGGQVANNAGAGFDINQTGQFTIIGATIGPTGTLPGNDDGVIIGGTSPGCVIGNTIKGNISTQYTNSSSGVVTYIGNPDANPIAWPANIVQGDTFYASAANGIVVRLSKDANATRYLSNTGASNNPAWAQINLTNGVTGDLPLSNLAQGSARSVAGVTGNATADFASIQGSAGQILGVPNAGTSLAFTATPQLGLSGTLGSITFGNATSGLLTLQTVTGALGTVTLSLPARTDTLVTLAGTEELDNKTLDASVAKGTWTTSGTWTVPAHTLGGTVTSNGQSFSGTIANLGTVTTADINGGTLDGTVIGGASAAAATVTTLTSTGTRTGTVTSSAGAGTVVGDSFNLTRTTTSGSADITYAAQYKFTESGSATTSPLATASLSVDALFQNANNTTTNYGIQMSAFTTVNLATYVSLATGFTVNGGVTLTNYTGLSIAAPSGTVTNKTAINVAASAGAIIQNDTTDATSTTDGPIRSLGGLSVAKNIIAGAQIRPGSYTVATMPAGIVGAVIYVSNMRVFNGAGTLEGAGAGTGGHATYNGAWKVIGTNINAQA